MGTGSISSDMTSPPFDLESVRAEIPILRTHVPVNNCSQAPQSAATRAAAETYLESWNRHGMDWDAWIEETEAARSEFAALIGADPEDVSVTASVSQAVASVATGLSFQSDRNRIVASEAEFPTVGHVWLAQERLGARVAWVPIRDGHIRLEDYAAEIDARTLVVSACHGYFQTGFKQDVAAIAEIAHEHGALLFVDAYQTLGTEPFDAAASGADFVASGNLKYLMGIPGIAFLWVRPGIAERLRPLVTGWFGRQDPFAFDPKSLDWAHGARRLDLGTPPLMAAYIARAGMSWLRRIGLDKIGAWTTLLGQRASDRARELGLEVMGPPDGSPGTPTRAIRCDRSHDVEVELRKRNIIASARGPAIRIAPHFYNTFSDVDTALDELERVLRGMR